MEEKQHFKLTVTGKGKNASYDVDKDSFILGRGKECEVVVEDDLISRKHMKISIQDGLIVLEELGSTNGTLINNIKMEKGQKVTYHSKSKILLGGSSGLSLSIEMAAAKNNVIKINTPEVSHAHENEKTVVASIPVLKVSNGSFEPVAKVVVNNQAATNKSVVKTIIQSVTRSAVKSAVTKNSAKPHGKTLNSGVPAFSVNKNIKLVSNEDSQPKDKTKVSSYASEKKSSIKQSFDDQVKDLVNVEAEKLRRQSLRDAEQIKKKALETEKAILSQAKLEASDIVEAAKKEAIKNRQDAEESIVTLKEKVKTTESESEAIIKNLKHVISDLEEKVTSLKLVESGHNQKIRQYDDEYSSIRERVKNEHLLLDELKLQSNTVKKSADLKLEEVILQERRSRATIETEIAEARTQTAKIFAEAERAANQRNLLEPEIQQLKTEKSKVEKDINEAQISFKRAEYELEKAHKDQSNLYQEINEARAKLEEILSKTKIQQDQISAAQTQFEEREKSLQLKIENAELSSQKILENAHAKARDIAADAQAKSQKVADQNARSLRDLENHKVKFNDDLEAEKKVKLLATQHEIERLKQVAQQELDKLETKKINLANELKWMETNAASNCEKLITQAKAEAQELKTQTLKNIELVKATAKHDAQMFKERVQKEIVSAKENAQTEIQNVKRESGLEIAAAKNKMTAEIAQYRFKAEEEVQKLKNELTREQNKAREDLKTEQTKISEQVLANEELKKSLQLAIDKTEKMMNDNHLQAEVKIKGMLADAHKKALAIEQEGKDLKAKELSNLADIRRAEIDKIEDLKAQFEEHRINSRNEMSEDLSSIIQESVVLDLIKSRNLPLDEKLIKKISEKVKKVASDVALGKIKASNKNINDLYKIQRTDYFGIVKILIALTVVGGAIYFYKAYPKESSDLIKEIADFIKKQDLTLPF